jgi:hypothetical protein
MATRVDVIIDPDASEVSDYSSMNAADLDVFGATSNDYIGNDEEVYCSCICTSGTADTTNVILTGYITDGAHSLNIEVDPAYRYFLGFPETGNYYRLDISTNTYGLSTVVDYLTLRGIPVRIAPASNNQRGIYCAGDNNLVDGCIVTRGNGQIQQIGINFEDCSGTIVKSCLVYGLDVVNAIGMFVTGTTIDCHIHNNAFVHCEKSYQSNTSSGVSFNNNVLFGALNNDMNGVLPKSAKNNAYSIGPDPGIDSIDLSTLDVEEIFIASGDYRLIGMSPLRKAGIQLYASGITTDITGAPRQQFDKFDIGAYQFEDFSSNFFLFA